MNLEEWKLFNVEEEVVVVVGRAPVEAHAIHPAQALKHHLIPVHLGAAVLLIQGQSWLEITEGTVADRAPVEVALDLVSFYEFSSHGWKYTKFLL